MQGTRYIFLQVEDGIVIGAFWQRRADKMEDDLYPIQNRSRLHRIGEISRQPLDASDIGPISGARRLVESTHSMPLADQTRTKVFADKTGATKNQDIHSMLPSTARTS